MKFLKEESKAAKRRVAAQGRKRKIALVRRSTINVPSKLRLLLAEILLVQELANFEEMSLVMPGSNTFRSTKSPPIDLALRFIGSGGTTTFARNSEPVIALPTIFAVPLSPMVALSAGSAMISAAVFLLLISTEGEKNCIPSYFLLTPNPSLKIALVTSFLSSSLDSSSIACVAFQRLASA